MWAMRRSLRVPCACVIWATICRHCSRVQGSLQRPSGCRAKKALVHGAVCALLWVRLHVFLAVFPKWTTLFRRRGLLATARAGIWKEVCLEVCLERREGSGEHLQRRGLSGLLNKRTGTCLQWSGGGARGPVPQGFLMND